MTIETPAEEPAVVAAEQPVSDKFLDLAADIRLDLDQLKAQLMENKSLGKFVENDKFNVTKALKSLSNAEKLIGKRLEEADAETLSSVYEKFGIPKSADEYDVSLEGADEAAIKSFKEMAKEAGIPKGAAQKLFEKINVKAPQEDLVAKEKAKIEKDLQSLQELFGDNMALKRTAANKALEVFGDEALKEHIAKSGMGTDPQFIKFLAEVGEKLMTKNIDSERPAAAKDPAADAREKIKEIRSSDEYRKAIQSPNSSEFKKLTAKLDALYRAAT